MESAPQSICSAPPISPPPLKRLKPTGGVKVSRPLRQTMKAIDKNLVPLESPDTALKRIKFWLKSIGNICENSRKSKKIAKNYSDIRPLSSTCPGGHIFKVRGMRLFFSKSAREIGPKTSNGAQVGQKTRKIHNSDFVQNGPQSHVVGMYPTPIFR